MTTPIRTPCDENILECGGAEAPCSKSARPFVLAATILASSMAFIDGTAVNVALPLLQLDLSASVSAMQWVVESYAIFLAALVLVGGAMGDRFGRRKIFLFGVVGFTLASLLCGLAQSASQLILARSVQGIGAALLVPGSLALITASFPSQERGAAIGTWAAFTAITTAFGPLLGGWLAENLSWRWVFFINVPLAVVVLVLSLRFVPESRAREVPGKIDWGGAILATYALGAMTFGFIESARLGLSHPWVYLTLGTGAIALVVFVWTESRQQNPMMPLVLFRSASFSGANLLTLFLYSSLAVVMFFLPFNMLQVQSYTATSAGAAFLPLILIIFLLSRWAGGLVHRIGPRVPLTVGPMVAAFGYVLFALPGVGGTYWTTYFPALVVLGLGMAISVAPLTTVVMNSVDERHMALASGINNSASRIAGVLSIAVLGVVVLAVFNLELDRALAGVDIPPEAMRVLESERFKLAGAVAPASLSAEVRSLIEMQIDHAFVSGFRTSMWISAALALLSGIVGWFSMRDETAIATEDSV